MKIMLLYLILQTDDKGVFCTSLSKEYMLAADWLNLSREQIWDLSYNAINHIFASDKMKEELHKKFSSIKSTLSIN